MRTPPAGRRFAGAWLLAAALACGAPEAEPLDGAGLSLLAVGDTGKPLELLESLDPGRAVAAAMTAEDLRKPVDALVLLGDNFYPDGLEEDEVKDRLRQNLVGQFCHFVELTQRGAGSLRDACPAARARHPVPLFAVLGNHDYGERESPELQRHLVPEYVASWHMPPGDVEVRELKGGLSLVLVDSNRLVRGDGERELVRALRRSRGPWRVVAAHHPMRDAGNGEDPRFEERIADLLAEARVPIHVWVAGHEHNLQAFAGEAPGPPLHLVAGSGSDVREISETADARLFASAALGFARLDVETEPEPRLVATLFEVPSPPRPPRARVAARFEVTLAGTARELPREGAGS
jgi:hypothetical protein